MTEEVVPILWATWATVAAAAEPLGTAAVVAGARSRLGRAAGRVSDGDVRAAIETLIMVGLVRVSWDGGGFEPGSTPPAMARLTTAREITWWRGRRQALRGGR